MRPWFLLALAGCTAPGTPVGSDSQPLTVHQACIPMNAPPIIYSQTIVNPYALDSQGNAPAGFHTTRGRFEPPVPAGQSPIEYVSGGWIEVHVVAEPCAVVQSVQIGDVVMPPAYGPTNGYSLVASTSVIDSAHTLFDLSAMYPSLGDGSTRQLIVTMARPGGSTSTWSFQLVDSAEVVPNVAGQTITPIGISEAEMTNNFISGLWDQFNGIADAVNYPLFPTDVVVHGPNYSTQVSLEILSDGVHFSFPVDADVGPGLCDEPLNISGIFMITAQHNHDMTVTWPWPVEVEPRVSNSILEPPCLAVELLPEIGSRIQDAIDAAVAAKVQQSMQAAMVKAFGSANSYEAFFFGATATDQELLVNLSTGLGPVVRINVPWDAFDMTTHSGTALPKNANVLMFAHGIGYHGGDPLWVGPDGVPNGPIGAPPLVASMPRDPSTLPFPSEWVDELVARTPAGSVVTQPATTYAYRYACALPAVSGNLRFGVNEAARAAVAARNTPGVAPGYQLSLQFAAKGSYGCPGFTPSPIVLGNL